MKLLHSQILVLTCSFNCFQTWIHLHCYVQHSPYVLATKAGKWEHTLVSSEIVVQEAPWKVEHSVQASGKQLEIQSWLATTPTGRWHRYWQLTFTFGKRHVPSTPACSYPTCQKTGLAKVVEEYRLVQSGELRDPVISIVLLVFLSTFTLPPRLNYSS